MADLNKKLFLDFEGLSQYDELIKKYIDAQNELDQGDIEEALQELTNIAAKAEANETAIATNAAAIEANTTAIGANTDALAVLNGDGEGSVSKKVSDAIAALVDSAPETFDTLKEIADWIANDETGTAALLSRVDDLEDANEANQEALEDLKDYVDAQDIYYYNNIESIELLKIASLFPVKQSAEQTALGAITAVEEGKAVELLPNQVIDDAVTIDKSCYIDANGATFNGEVTVPADKEVVIVNATFSNPVKIV